LLLLAERRKEYAEHVADELLPVVGRVLSGGGTARESIGGEVALTLLPLAVSQFTDPIPDALIRRVAAKVDGLPRGDDDTDLVCQLVLRAAGRRLGDRGLTEKGETRLAAHPARGRWDLTSAGEVDLGFLLRIRAAFLLHERLAVMFGGDHTPRPMR
jgi:hypothetical protein